jgi:hypothetical protein
MGFRLCELEEDKGNKYTNFHRQSEVSLLEK